MAAAASEQLGNHRAMRNAAEHGLEVVGGLPPPDGLQALFVRSFPA